METNKLTSAQKKWLDDNCYKGMMAAPRILSLRPDIGFYIKLDDIDVSEAIFPEEYDELIKIHHHILDKLKEHYDKLSKDAKKM